ncbi:MAG: zinc ribbon domain-containing protein, partial [Oscillospiraceae bacterium]|nr:zinc ribbon domain-containing protein [Oscillospiraceae bacterium]
MFCPQCGKQIPDQSKFCPGCGATLTDAVKAAVQQPQSFEQPAQPQTYAQTYA